MAHFRANELVPVNPLIHTSALVNLESFYLHTAILQRAAHCYNPILANSGIVSCDNG